MLKFIKFLVVSLVLLPDLCFATLGENISSIDKDNHIINSNTSVIASPMITNSPNYQTVTFNASNNLIIKEFVANKKVFAIKWMGQSYPNLPQLLGSYFSQLKTSTKSSDGLTNTKLTGKDFILFISGLPGTLYGIAYIPSLMPNNINPYNLK